MLDSKQKHSSIQWKEKNNINQYLTEWNSYKIYIYNWDNTVILFLFLTIKGYMRWNTCPFRKIWKLGKITKMVIIIHFPLSTDKVISLCSYSVDLSWSWGLPRLLLSSFLSFSQFCVLFTYYYIMAIYLCHYIFINVKLEWYNININVW